MKTETETKKTGRTRLRKLDTRSPKEKWLASLASRPLLYLKQKNRAVQNYSKVNFPKRATEVLGLGFKFRPTLKPPKQDDLKSQFNAFCRSVRLNTLFSSERSIDKDDYNPRLYVRSDWDPPRSDLVLESNLRAIRYDLSLNLFNKPNWFLLHDLNYPDCQAIRQIKDNESVMVLPADKNLGLVILDKEWVITETLGMLMTDSYAVVDESERLLKRDYIIKQRDKVCDIYKYLLSETELKYLSHFDDLSESLLPARFYIIPKIHKNPMVGRPITWAGGGQGGCSPPNFAKFFKISLFCLKFWHFYAYSPPNFQLAPALSNSLRRLCYYHFMIIHNKIYKCPCG